MFYKMDTAGNVVDSFEAPAEASSIFGLDWDGTNLVGAVGNRIVSVDTSGNHVSTLQTDATSSMGLAYDGTSYVTFDFNYPGGVYNDGIVRINATTGSVTGFIPKGNPNYFGYHVFASLGNNQWLTRDSFVSASSSFRVVTFEFGDMTPNANFFDNVSTANTNAGYTIGGASASGTNTGSGNGSNDSF